MIKETIGIGLMSGTSLDGVDICVVKFINENNHWNFDILTAKTISYRKTLHHQLKSPYKLSAIQLTELDHQLGEFYGEITKNYIQENNLSNKIDFVATHGHTIFHNPEKKYTLQIGAPEKIFAALGIPVIADFRIADVAFNGNGAPLVPVGDLELFHQYNGCINIGGFANISVKKNQQIFAYDICPTNTIINTLIEKEYPTLNYDENGDIGRKGNVINDLLDALNQLSFYHQNHPKSLGIEFNNNFIYPILNQSLSKYSFQDVLHTFYHHIAFQIGENINKHFKKEDNILITGGGAFNHFLMELIKNQSKAKIIIPENKIIEFKEALIFAFLGLLKLAQKTNTLADVTGSNRDLSSGIIYDFYQK